MGQTRPSPDGRLGAREKPGLVERESGREGVMDE